MKNPCKIYYCYKATNKDNGKVYIGFATNPQQRWREHKRDAEKGRGYVFHAAIRKYGWDAFEFKVICCGKSKRDMLKYVEPRLIKQHMSLVTQNGYNIYKKAGRPKKSNGLLGKKFSEETKRRMSEARLGMKFSKVHRLHLSESHKGKPTAWTGRQHTNQAKQKISQSLIGVPRAAKYWSITYPDGKVEQIVNMAVFCKQHKLSAGDMSMVASGKTRHHRGYRCAKIVTQDLPKDEIHRHIQDKLTPVPIQQSLQRLA
jgi:group I intron endonuclease